MDTSRFCPRGPEFSVLDLAANFDFKTPCSIGFNLGRWSGGRAPAEGAVVPRDRGGVFTNVGRLEVHHPCEGHIKAQVTVVLKDPYHQWERMRDLVHQAFTALSIPADETFEAYFVSPTKQSLMAQRIDRTGYTDELA